MSVVNKPSIFIAVLNMGLGHATRSLPLIHYLLNKNWRVVIGSSGRSQIFLKTEVPAASFIDLPDYRLRYSTKGVRISGLLPQIPKLWQAISQEHQITEQIVKNMHLQAVISDHRYGCYSRFIPSLFISHQLRFAAPPFLRPFEIFGFWLNRWFHKKFQAVIIPDILQKKEGLISGRLSRTSGRSGYHFCGILSSIKKNELKTDLDLLVSISGPEPQRTIFEKKIRQQIKSIPGEKVVVLGKPEIESRETTVPGVTIYSHLSRQKLEEYFNRSRLIITRSGFSTLMELVELGKKALLVPTPGQTEQLLLAERLMKLNWFYSVSQDHLDLAKDIIIARGYPGAPTIPNTQETLPKMYQILSDELMFN
jgi:UDP-N-acetylglucosamine transferase subunit ALG13